VIRYGILALLLLPLSGCLALRSTLEAEMRHGQRLEGQLKSCERHSEELKRRIRELEASEQTLELERELLSEERVQLLSEIDEIRTGNQALRETLAAERQVRESREAEIKEIAGTYQNLVERLEGEVESGKLEIHRLRGRLQVRALEQILFNSGSSRIKAEGQEVLAKLAAQLATIPGHDIRVEGHTDNVPIATDRFPSNWELAGARAAGVVRFLIDQGLDPTKLSAVGYGEQQPIAENDTREGRARNRRIEIVLVPEAGD
jgi:chemotaxis protein MotB